MAACSRRAQHCLNSSRSPPSPLEYADNLAIRHDVLQRAAPDEASSVDEVRAANRVDPSCQADSTTCACGGAMKLAVHVVHADD